MKKTLDFDYGEHLDFALIGIVCAHKDFRLCFEMDKTLEIKLCKEDDFELKKDRRGSASNFSQYHYNNGDNEQYIVLGNKGSNGYFINELRHVDYFLLIKNISPFHTMENIIEQLKKISIITRVEIIEATHYKSSENFLLIDV